MTLPAIDVRHRDDLDELLTDDVSRAHWALTVAAALLFRLAGLGPRVTSAVVLVLIALAALVIWQRLERRRQMPWRDYVSGIVARQKALSAWAVTAVGVVCSYGIAVAVGAGPWTTIAGCGLLIGAVLAWIAYMNNERD